MAAVLGGDLHAQITRRNPSGSGGQGGGNQGELDIEVLLRGAEKLCTVYPLPGALERIPAQRRKNEQLMNTLAYYEARVAEQQEQLDRLNLERYAEDDEEEDGPAAAGRRESAAAVMTEEDLRREEEEIRELDRKRRELQARLRATERDLNGLMEFWARHLPRGKSHTRKAVQGYAYHDRRRPFHIPSYACHRLLLKVCPIPNNSAHQPVSR